jgi:hypothetical protein
MYNWIYDRAGAGAIIAEATGHFRVPHPTLFLGRAAIFEIRGAL